MVTGTISTSGFCPIATASEATMGSRILAVATLEHTSVQNDAAAVTTNTTTGRGTAASARS